MSAFNSFNSVPITGSVPQPQPENEPALTLVAPSLPTSGDKALMDYEFSIRLLLRDTRVFQRRVYAWLKRTLDITGALLLLLTLFPLCVCVAVLLKVNDPAGPVFFRQRRLGRYGCQFWCYKFRTMVPDAEAKLRNDPILRAEFEQTYKLKSDPRVTRLGAFLRSTSTDEIPQLWNVLRGEMSLIGPRPIVPSELNKYGPHGRKLLMATPGLSGLWQAYGRSNTSYDQRIRIDMLYIDNRSLWLDLQLLLATVAAVCRKLGAY